MKNNNILLIHRIFLLITILYFVLCFFIVQRKEIFYLDEVWSFFLSNYQATSFQNIWNSLWDGSLQTYITHEYDKILTGACTQKEFMDILSVPEGHSFDYFNTYCLQSFDVHPPLYYFFIHTLCVITHSQNLALIGYFVNIVFLVITLFFLYKIICSLTGDSLLAIAALCFYMFSSEFIDTAFYFRMYSMSACWITMIIYYHLKIAMSEYDVTNNLMLKICLVEFAALYTHYFSLYSIVAVVLLSTYILFSKGLKWKKYLKFQFSTAFLYIALWPQCLYHVMKLNSINTTYYHIGDFRLLVYGYAKLLRNSFFFSQWILLVLFIAMSVFLIVYYMNFKWTYCKYWLKSELAKKYFLVFVPAIFYYFCVVFFTNLITQRYLAPVMPIISVFITLIVWNIIRIAFKRMNIIKWSYLSLFFLIISISGCGTYTKMTNKVKEYAQNKNDVTKYCQGTAIIWDDNRPLYVDILKNYPHSKYIHAVSNYSEKYFSDKLEEDYYMLYVSICCDTKDILKYFENRNYTCKESDLKTNFYKVYVLNLRNATSPQ